MAANPQALLWDVDGTLAETELYGHRVAFNRAFAECGFPWHWDALLYQHLLRISGGRERIRHYLASLDAAAAPPDEALVERLQTAKQRHYSTLVAAGELRLRPGVARLLRSVAAAGIPQVVVTTSGRAAVAALLERTLPDHQALFRFWVCGEDVSRKKPDPQAYQIALEQLQLPAAAVLAVEDSANGVAAAAAAALPVLVSRSASSALEPDAAFVPALAVLDQLGEPTEPCTVQRGPACAGGHVTLSYLQQLFHTA
jgi:HAD superfamily hydrolase (TIGR01509 family)